jgi:hypothetical protein
VVTEEDRFRVAEQAAWEAFQLLFPEATDFARIKAFASATSIIASHGAMRSAAGILDAIHARVDWLDDVDPADGWIPSSGKTRERALAVAREIFSVAGSFGFTLQLPAFEPTASGGVDIRWKTKSLELLLAVPASGNMQMQYFGDTPTGECIKGTVTSLYVRSFLPLVAFLGVHEKA